MAKSKTYLSKTEYKKEWRRKNKEDKRFNRPLKEYLKLKHSAIYGEYCTFFKVLDKLNPTAKDLTKTATFNEWKKQLNASDDEFGGPLIKLNTYYVKDDGETVTAATQELIAQEPDLHAEDTEGKLNTYLRKRRRRNSYSRNARTNSTRTRPARRRHRRKTEHVLRKRRRRNSYSRNARTNSTRTQPARRRHRRNQYRI